MTPSPLRCSACKLGALVLPSGGDGDARCDACSRSVLVRDGVVELVPIGGGSRTAGQQLMEWSPLVRIYESRWWRRGVGAAFVMGLPFEREQEHVLRALASHGSMRVLDLACGSGLYTRAIARALPDGQVVGLDLSPAMLAFAVRAARRERVANVLWVRGDAMALPFADGSLDAVNCCGALHLFPDVSRALDEIHRVLRVGGTLTAAVARRTETRRSGAVAALAARIGIASWTEPEFRARALGAGLRDLECHHAQRAWMIWSARKPNGAPSAERAAPSPKSP